MILCPSADFPSSSFHVQHAYRCPLQVRKFKGMILDDLENALAEHAPPAPELSSELPPLTIDGIPVSVDKMTQVPYALA